LPKNSTFHGPRRYYPIKSMIEYEIVYSLIYVFLNRARALAEILDQNAFSRTIDLQELRGISVRGYYRIHPSNDNIDRCFTQVSPHIQHGFVLDSGSESRS
jgi:hypothetical protein